jgi:hypothetical protein
MSLHSPVARNRVEYIVVVAPERRVDLISRNAFATRFRR